jgi:hypothetical protein
MQEYARICIGAYFAYFAYICTPYFADGVVHHPLPGTGLSRSARHASDSDTPSRMHTVTSASIGGSPGPGPPDSESFKFPAE